jgi:hypothetical protein
MKRFSNSAGTLFALLALGALVVVLVFFFQAQQNQSGMNLIQPASSSTCVPRLTNQNQAPSNPGTISPPYLPSVTPLPISKTTDLAPNLADQDKARVYVMRCSGAFEVFLIGPTNAEISKMIPLQTGDTVLSLVPAASSMGHRPPRADSTTTFGSPLATPTRSSLTLVLAAFIVRAMKA